MKFLYYMWEICLFFIMYCQSSKTIYSLTPSEQYHIFKFGLAECMGLYSHTLNVHWIPQWDPCVWKWIFLHSVTSSAHNLTIIYFDMKRQLCLQAVLVNSENMFHFYTRFPGLFFATVWLLSRQTAGLLLAQPTTWGFPTGNSFLSSTELLYWYYKAIFYGESHTAV